MIILSTVGSIKKILFYKMSYFPEPYTHSKKKIKVELDLYNYVTKSDFKNATGGDILKFSKNADLACLKREIDELDFSNLKTTPVDLNTLSNVLKSEVVKKDAYDELVRKIRLILF